MYEDDKFYFEWKITNFSFAAWKTGNAILSPPFVVDALDETRWTLAIYPRGKEDGEYIDIFVTRMEEDDGGVVISITFTIELEAADSSRQERRVSLKSRFERGTTFGFPRYIRRMTLLEDMKSVFLPDDVLTVHCTLERAPVEVEYIKEHIAETFIMTFEKEFMWDVKNLLDASDCGDFKEVHFTDELKASFQLIICEVEDVKSLILKVRKLEPEKDNCLSCRISILDNQGSEALVRTTHHSFVDGLQIIPQHLFHRREIKDSYWQDGILSLRCVLSMEVDKGSEAITQKVHESSISENVEEYVNKELVKDYENMYLNGNFSDLKVKAGGKVINCHKSILNARSPVMRDLLNKADQASNGCTVIDIEDLDGDILERMIYFMYSDKINNINHTTALKLFVAGHKYQIKYLKQKCSLYLKTAFTFENVYDILMAAHIYEDGSLKRHAISYIGDYFSHISLTTEWANFRKSEKELAAYTCSEIRRMKNL